MALKWWIKQYGLKRCQMVQDGFLCPQNSLGVKIMGKIEIVGKDKRILLWPVCILQTSQARSYNKQMRPAILDHCSGNKWTNTSHHPEYLVGEEALYVNPLDCYNIHWPIRRGQLNIHPGPGGSLTAVLADIEVIWSHAIQKYLEIPLKDLKYYRCILLIPDIYNKQHVKELVNMILMKMGFSGIVVHQESVCATFGSGLSSTCIVDVGDQKTSVCCVEDGVSHRNTRLCLAYGGSDVSRCFYWLMQRAGFPYRECQLTNKMDCLLLQHLKETFCHLDQDISGLQDHEFQIRHPDSPALLYQFRLGDEKLQAPMALFYPATFGIVGQKMTTLQHRSQGDPEDPHDEHYLLATQSKQEQSAKATADRKSASKPIGFEGDLRGQSSDIPERLHSQEVDLGSSQGDCLMAGNDSEEALTALMSRKTAISLFEGKALGLDKAILHSIDCCSSDDTKKKMYSSILVVGGGLMFHKAQEFLQHRILNKMPPSFRRIIENVDVITRPKNNPVPCLGHGSPADCVERRSSAGVFGHDTGTVDLSARMAALWCPHAARAGCFCVVTWGGEVTVEDQKQVFWYRRLKNVCVLIY
ncbi:actin-related protein 8 isoform X3 [Cavia porcellus]|uniref:actin-related protein 8 isoform X3 n=1 Tax=Cavia porcellus TaxID=10141 RepID=UPI002FDF81AC